MAEETIEQLKQRLTREDEEKERAWQYTLKEIEAEQAQWRAQREAEARAKQEEFERLRTEEQREYARAEERRTKEDARRHWLEAGGTPEDFEKAWPDMWRETLVARTLERESQVRLEFQKHIAGTF
jgi:hypothetical protein